MDPGLRADQLVYGLEGRPDTSVDVAIACPTAPTFSVGIVSSRKSRLTGVSTETPQGRMALQARLGVSGFQTYFVSMV